MIRKMMDLKLNHYGVILADPPWKFKTYSKKGKGRSAEAHYDCMDFDQIASLPIVDFAAPDCVLFLWVTDPMLPRAFELMSAWGFVYKTVGFYWAKLNPRIGSYFCEDNFSIGTGYYTRANPEQCLLATRGHPKRLNADVRKLIISPRREHSRKPDEIYDRVEQLCAGPYLELFARARRPGWDAWGDQVDTGITARRWASDSHPDATP